MKTVLRQQKVSPIILATMLLALPLYAYAKDTFTFKVQPTQIDVPCALSDKTECGQMKVDLLNSGNTYMGGSLQYAVEFQANSRRHCSLNEKEL